MHGHFDLKKSHFDSRNRVPDDHGLYVDLDAAILLGGAIDDPVSASSHGFTSKNEKKVKKYLDDLNQYFKDHKICQWIDKFVVDALSLTRPQLKSQYEGIDNDITRGMLVAEQKVHPYQTFRFEWSPELDKA
jgi:hypothetical protein